MGEKHPLLSPLCIEKGGMLRFPAHSRPTSQTIKFSINNLQPYVEPDEISEPDSEPNETQDSDETQDDS
jgi:hypothetical protein